MAAITGSVGKTTTKEMLRAALSAFGATWAAEASHNNHWGVPLTLARLPPDAAFCVVEIGMNHPGEIAPLSRLAQPEVAAVTGIAPAHIGHMGSLEAIALEKLSIADGLGRSPLNIVVAGLDPAICPHRQASRRDTTDARTKPGHDDRFEGSLVLPSEGPALPTWNKAALTFGREKSDTIQLLRTESDAASNRIEIRVGRQTLAFTLRAPGPHMAQNAACALAMVVALGLDPARAAAALHGFAPLAGRGTRRTLHLPKGEAILLDESYNASSTAVRAALHVLGLQNAERRIAVLGDMLELGHYAKAEHAGLAPDVEANADLLFTCGTLMRVLHDAVPPAIRGMHAEDSEELAPIVASAVRAGDAVLVKGSLGSRMHRVVRALEAAG